MAALSGGTALVLAVRETSEGAFVAAAVGAVTWFLSYRVQLREKLSDTDETDENDKDS